MVETSALLIPKGELDKYLAGVLKSEQELTEDLERILPFVKSKSLSDSLSRRLAQGRGCLAALKAGYVPVSSGFFTKTDTKSKWRKKQVEETVASMPHEVKEIWEKVKSQGVFDSFSVTIRGGGDPLLVGNKGGKHFFIAGWLSVAPGIGLGLRIKLPR